MSFINARVSLGTHITKSIGAQTKYRHIHRNGQTIEVTGAECVIIFQMSVVCDKEILQSIAKMSFFIGVLFGDLIAGMASDRYRIKFVFFFCGKSTCTVPNWPKKNM